MPCEDAVISGQDETQFQQVDISHHSGTHADDCSPFCQCHCCHVHITNFQDVAAELVSLEISTEISDKQYDLGDDIPRSFFQPPRV